jgi:NDP-sugar pyrophosphorylase family protein
MTHEACAVVLAGSQLGSDSSLDGLLPRALLPIANAPAICHLLGWLREAGISRVAICANRGMPQIRHVLRDGRPWAVELEYFEDWIPRGPAGCIRDAAEQLGAKLIVVVEATIVPSCDLTALLKEHLCSGSAMTVAATSEIEAPQARGANQRLVPAGIYLLDRRMLEHIPQNGYQDIKEVLLPRLHAHGLAARVQQLEKPCLRITDVESYLTLSASVTELLVGNGHALAGHLRAGRSVFHQSAHVAAPAGIVGPVLIGPDTEIAADATVIGPSVIGRACRIESGAIVCGSVLWDECCVGRSAVLNRCIAATGVEIEADTNAFRTVFARPSNGEQHNGFAPSFESLLYPLPTKSVEGKKPAFCGAARRDHDASASVDFGLERVIYA